VIPLKFNNFIFIPVAAALVATTVYPSIAAGNPTETIQKSTTAFQEFVDKGRIPPSILRSSQGIAIIPNVIQAALILGGQRGKGVMVVRTPDGSWSKPFIITLTGGSIGLQAGIKSSDIVLAFQDKASIRKVYRSDFDLGGNVSGTAGPGGIQAVYPSDSVGNIYSYFKSEGLFGGVSLSGVKLNFDKDDTGRLYGQKNITPRQVFSGEIGTTPTVVSSLQSALSLSSAASSSTVTTQQENTGGGQLNASASAPTETETPVAAPTSTPAETTPVRGLW
jgi:SH3 domain-containing YSC84-like protein 1